MKHERCAISSLRRSAREARLPIVGMLDDHDNGRNDASGNNPYRSYAKRLFLDFFNIESGDVWRRRAGLYRSQLYSGTAPDGTRRVTQLLLVDVRSFRAPEWTSAANTSVAGHERYEQDLSVSGLSASILGDEQWRWLEAQLRTPAHLRVLVSTIQVIPQAHGWERWGLFPHELARLLAALRTAAPAPDGGASGVLLLSGDRHLGALYRHTPTLPEMATPSAEPSELHAWDARDGARREGPTVYELTSSALTHSSACTLERPCPPEEGPMLVGPLIHENNWGELTVDWAARTLALTLRAAATVGHDGARRVLGEPLLEHQIGFDELHMR
jgi:alkaline phosphatase D